MKKISVIIPCYNVENVVGNCIKSLINQDIGVENMELIFVNDASTDHTYDVLCQWEKYYPESIIVINCGQNGNIGGARNVGMSYASGKYIGFVDGDDILEHAMYHDMYEAAERQQADIVSCGIRRCTLREYLTMEREGNTYQRTAEKDWVIHMKDKETRQIFLKGDTNASVCNRLFRRQLIEKNNIVFKNNMYYEDIYFSSIIRRYAEIVCGVEEVFYNHIVYEQSASINMNQEVKEDYIRLWIMTYDEIKHRGLYEGFETYYDQKLVSEYITYVYACFRIFGLMNTEQWNRAIGMIRDRIDVRREYRLDNDKIDSQVQKQIFECLKKSVTRGDGDYFAGLICGERG